MTDVSLLFDAEPGQQLDLSLLKVPGHDAYVEATPQEEYWAGIIVHDLRSSVASIVSAGVNLIAAKAALPHGSWLPMLKLAGVGERKAQTLIKIASHPILSDPQQAALLPAGWTTLAELAELGEDDVRGALASGIIGPDLTRTQAEALRPPPDRDLGDEDHTMDDEPDPAKPKTKSPQEHAEARDAAVFSTKQAVTRLQDCLKLISAPGFRLTVEVAQDIQRELNKLDKVYGDLLIRLDEEVGHIGARAPRKSPPIPAKSTEKPAAAGGIKANRTDVSLGGLSDTVGDQTLTLDEWKARQ